MRRHQVGIGAALAGLGLAAGCAGTPAQRAPERPRGEVAVVDRVGPAGVVLVEPAAKAETVRVTVDDDTLVTVGGLAVSHDALGEGQAVRVVREERAGDQDDHAVRIEILRGDEAEEVRDRTREALGLDPGDASALGLFEDRPSPAPEPSPPAAPANPH